VVTNTKWTNHPLHSSHLVPNRAQNKQFELPSPVINRNHPERSQQFAMRRTLISHLVTKQD
jgi:hypothetical protein